jgi:Ca2+-binding EF-hand superfamily protein
LPTQSAPDSAKLVPDGTVSAVAEDEEDISDEEKLNRIFLKFDVDKDGILNKQEASAYSVAKEGEGLDDDTWAQICEVLEVDPETGMSLADFQKMYELTAGEGNVIGLDYLKLCVVS